MTSKKYSWLSRIRWRWIWECDPSCPTPSTVAPWNWSMISTGSSSSGLFPRIILRCWLSTHVCASYWEPVHHRIWLICKEVQVRSTLLYFLCLGTHRKIFSTPPSNSDSFSSESIFAAFALSAWNDRDLCIYLGGHSTTYLRLEPVEILLQQLNRLHLGLFFDLIQHALLIYSLSGDK